MASRRFYWLKLPEDFFRRGYIRRLRNRENGDRLVLIYLELLLAALKTEGRLPADGDPAEELALELYEEESEVKALLQYLTEYGKLTSENDAEYHLTDCEEMTGSETGDARRMRDSRRRRQEEKDAVPMPPVPFVAPDPGLPRTISDEEFARQMDALRRR